jgi:L-ascorbate metabolism protein UlaG (beta-lactamase superfamily)
VTDDDFGPRLAAWRPPAGSIGIVALGQAGIGLRGREDLILIDPFLSLRPDRITQPPVDPASLRGVTAVLATHEHVDHLDLGVWPAIADASPEARFVVAEPLAPLVTEAGIPSRRVLGVRPRRPIQLGSARITAVPARHGVHVEDAYSLGPGDVPRWVGYVVELDGVRLYHAGDSLSDPVIVDAVRGHVPHVAFLPINGRDAEREARDIVGNMTPDEAALMARDLGVALAVPIHFNGIRGNEGSPDAFVAAVRRHHPSATVWVPSVGARSVWPDGRVSPPAGGA